MVTLIYSISYKLCTYLPALFIMTVPDPIVKVTTIGNQTVGDPLSLRCDVATINSIDNVYIIWKINGTEAKLMTDTIKSQINTSSVMYTNFYNITLLQLHDNKTKYQCQAVIKTHLYPLIPAFNATSNLTLFVNGKYTIFHPLYTRLYTYLHIYIYIYMHTFIRTWLYHKHE